MATLATGLSEGSRWPANPPISYGSKQIMGNRAVIYFQHAPTRPTSFFGVPKRTNRQKSRGKNFIFGAESYQGPKGNLLKGALPYSQEIAARITGTPEGSIGGLSRVAPTQGDRI